MAVWKKEYIFLRIFKNMINRVYLHFLYFLFFLDLYFQFMKLK